MICEEPVKSFLIIYISNQLRIYFRKERDIMFPRLWYNMRQLDVCLILQKRFNFDVDIGVSEYWRSCRQTLNILAGHGDTPTPPSTDHLPITCQWWWFHRTSPPISVSLTPMKQSRSSNKDQTPAFRRRLFQGLVYFFFLFLLLSPTQTKLPSPSLPLSLGLSSPPPLICS